MSAGQGELYPPDKQKGHYSAAADSALEKNNAPAGIAEIGYN